MLIKKTSEWIVVSKPAGWLTIPGRSNPDSKVPSPEVLSEVLKKEFGPELWTVHRLDRETSGVILFARSAEAHRKAGLWFQNHEVKKLYHCLALGAPSMPILKIKVPIEGAPSSSQVEVKEKFSTCFLGQVRPLTGRRHQIRIHLSSQGFPILGDVQYKGPRELNLETGKVLIPRVALHAAKLELPGGESFEAPWPEDFSSWVTTFRKNRAEASHGV